MMQRLSVDARDIGSEERPSFDGLCTGMTRLEDSKSRLELRGDRTAHGMRRGGMTDRAGFVFKNWNKNKMQTLQQGLIFSGHGGEKRAALIFFGRGCETANGLRHECANRLIAKLHGGGHLSCEGQP